MTRAFLWGGDNAPEVSAFVARRHDWWEQYVAGLRISAAAKNELFDACRRLVALLPDPQYEVPLDKPARGLAVGAVQSGKTAAMIGLTAMALDQGYRVVIVLGGNKDDLRRQTARRFNTQLLRRSEIIPGSGGARTIPQPTSVQRLQAYSLPFAHDCHQDASFHLGLQAALAEGRSAVLVIKKHPTSLGDTRAKLEIAFRRLGVRTLPVLVLDDECDDASVDRAGLPVPEAIAGLLRRPEGDQPLAAYVGFTATSAANLLQTRDNELFPETFVTLLRYPGADTSSLSFEEPSPDRWYTGGTDYLEAFGEVAGPHENFLVVDRVTDADAQHAAPGNASLLEAVRAFIVGGAFRLALKGDWSLTDISRLPEPHSMLVQTSASQADHRSWLGAISDMFGGTLARGEQAHRWSAEHVAADVAQNELAWRRWFEDFAGSRARVLEERPRINDGRVVTWNQVKELIVGFASEVRLKIVNSDEAVGADLDFALRVNDSGAPSRPQDMFVVAIGGAVLSRGLTVEGLAVTFFTRWNPTPTEDTVLQLCRWYGYRGRILEFCRLFTTSHIHSQLCRMHDNDRSLRNDLAALMKKGKSPADAAIVIACNPRAYPTAKLGDGTVHDLAFSPFATVFHHLECTDPDMQRANLEKAVELVGAIRSRSPRVVVASSGARRGLVSEGWSALEVADMLERIQYADHNPSAEANPARRYYRNPDAGRPTVHGRRLEDDPYQVAAYLRQWEAGGGAPDFNVGVAFGEMSTDIRPFDFPLTNREILPDGELVGGWTGRRLGWRGDQLFDDPEGRTIVDGTSIRQPGSRGLLLLYVIHKSSLGRAGRGLPRACHTPAFGIVIPDGGPVWRRVTVDRQRMLARDRA